MNISSSPSHYLFDNKPVHYFILSLLLLISLYCISSAFKRGIANVWYFNAEFSLNETVNEKAIKDESNYKQVLTSIIKAQSLDTKHPHYAHMVGRIMHWGVDLGYKDKAQLEEITQWYLLATQLRPLWPDPWVDLLRLNNFLYGYNANTKYYIEQALATGPYTDLVTIGTIQVWLLNWSELSGKERELLFKQFDIATKQKEVLYQVLQFAKSIYRENLLCSQLKFNKDYLITKETYEYKLHCFN